MTAHFLALVAMIPLSFAAHFPTLNEVYYERPFDLKLFLDWSIKFSGDYETRKEEYERFVEEEVEIFELTEFEGIGKTFSEFVPKAANLGRVLVKGESANIVLDTEVGVNMHVAIGYLHVMVSVFRYLKAKLIVWETQMEEAEPITKVTDAVPLEWFMKHGFDVETLNDATLEQVKTALYEMIGNGEPLKRMLSFLGTSGCIKPGVELSATLYWVLAFTGSAETMKFVEAYLSREGSPMPADRTADLMEQLHEVGKPNGPLRKLLGKHRGDPIYSVHYESIKHAKFLERNVEKYLDALTRMAEVMDWRLEVLENSLRKLKGETDETVNIQGLMFNFNDVSPKELADQIHELITPNGLIYKLSMAAIKYDAAVHRPRLPRASTDPKFQASTSTNLR